MKVSVIQMESGADKARNIAEMLRLLEGAVRSDGIDLAVFPEMAPCLTADREVLQGSGETIHGAFVQAIQEAARKFSVNVVLGSFMEEAGGSFFNTSLLAQPRRRCCRALQKDSPV